DRPVDRQRQEMGRRVALSSRSRDPCPDTPAEEEVEVDDELDVTVVQAAVDQPRGQDEQMFAAVRSFAEDVPRGLSWTAELHADGAVAAPEDGGVEDLNLLARSC